MTPNVRYITQLTKQDLREIADAVNVIGTNIVIVTPTADGLEVSLDRDQLRQTIKRIIQTIVQ